MPYLKYNKQKGALHIGGGRFFYPNEPIEVSEDEAEALLKRHSDLEEVKADDKVTPASGTDVTKKYTKTQLKKLTEDEQLSLLVELGGNPEDSNSEDELIEQILKLQG
ncbi:hypothetical protein [Paenibacillus sp. W2I17]|uniref:hypothetical protein n=1 Tax=Paenibacillus sp. W2I17 TaxID=3042311 RepID=UPI00278548D0|nr:hypothetical protein [Paenibacillus sp. W2I17]MDQ0658764.1 hypothetical protein [Paenibacillus sp. W2I17]